MHGGSNYICLRYEKHMCSYLTLRCMILQNRLNFRKFVYEFELGTMCQDRDSTDVMACGTTPLHNSQDDLEGKQGDTRLHVRLAIPFESLQLCTIHNMVVSLLISLF